MLNKHQVLEYFYGLFLKNNEKPFADMIGINVQNEEDFEKVFDYTPDSEWTAFINDYEQALANKGEPFSTFVEEIFKDTLNPYLEKMLHCIDGKANINHLKDIIGEIEDRTIIGTADENDIDKAYDTLLDVYEQMKEYKDLPGMKNVLEDYASILTQFEQQYIYTADIQTLHKACTVSDRDTIVDTIFEYYLDEDLEKFKGYGQISNGEEFAEAMSDVPQSVLNKIVENFDKNLDKGMLYNEALLDGIKSEWDNVRTVVLARSLEINTTKDTTNLLKDLVVENEDLTSDEKNSMYKNIVKETDKFLTAIARMGEITNPDVQKIVDEKTKSAYACIEKIENEVYHINKDNALQPVVEMFADVEKNKPIPSLIYRLTVGSNAQFSKEWNEFSKSNISFTDYNQDGRPVSAILDTLADVFKDVPDRVMIDLAIKAKVDPSGKLFENTMKEIGEALVVINTCDKEINNLTRQLTDARENENAPGLTKTNIQNEKSYYKEFIMDNAKPLIQDGVFNKTPNNALLVPVIEAKMQEAEKLLQQLETSAVIKTAKSSLSPSITNPYLTKIANTLFHLRDKISSGEMSLSVLDTWERDFASAKERAIEAMAMLEYEIDNNPNINKTEYRNTETGIFQALYSCCQEAGKHNALQGQKYQVDKIAHSIEQEMAERQED